MLKDVKRLLLKIEIEIPKWEDCLYSFSLIWFLSLFLFQYLEVCWPQKKDSFAQLLEK